MSISRIFHEFRPLFRILDQPLLARPQAASMNFPNRLDDSFLTLMNQPPIDIKEEGNKIILDADVPGVKKENIDVRVGDNGQSITIQGKMIEASGSSNGQAKTNAFEPDSTGVVQPDDSTQISTERPYTKNISFTRTVWLPRPIDPQNISAKLDHGVLTLVATKKEDPASTLITIE